VKQRFGSMLLVGALVVGAIFAVLQPNRPPSADAAPFLNNAPSVCMSTATTTGTTTSLGTFVTSTVSTIVSTITTTTTSWIPGGLIEVPYPPFFVPGPPVPVTVPWVTTSTSTTTVPVTEKTTSTGTTTGYVTSTVDCPSTTTSTSTSTPTATTSSSTSVAPTTSASPDGNSAVSGLVSVDNDLPLANATVLVGGSVTKTDAGGHFLVAHLPAGSYIVSVSYPSGYRAASPNSYTAILDGTDHDAFDFYGTSSPAGAAFQPFWVETFRAAVLQSGTDPAAVSFGAVPQWSFLLVVQPEAGGWLYVYNPETHNYGYIAADNVGPSGPPH
jgi:hypothetical protein